MSEPTLALFNLPGGIEWIVIGAVALLIFGRRLPDVARSIGKSIVEFKRGIREVKEDIEAEPRLDSKRPKALEDANSTARDDADHRPDASSQPVSEKEP